jgi:hypothetical protein
MGDDEHKGHFGRKLYAFLAIKLESIESMGNMKIPRYEKVSERYDCA